MTRVDRLKKVKARVAPILYMESACGIRLQADDDIFQLFTNGRASISLGYIGVHETVNAVFGTEPHLLESEEKQAKKEAWKADAEKRRAEADAKREERQRSGPRAREMHRREDRLRDRNTKKVDRGTKGDGDQERIKRVACCSQPFGDSPVIF